MNLGAAFVNLARGNIPSHLWLVVSNPTGANRLAIVNVSSDNDGLADLPILTPADHSWLDRDSFVRAHQAMLSPIARIREGFAKKPPLLIEKDPLTAAVLAKLQHALYVCRHTRREIKQVLVEQGFIRPSTAP